MSISRIPAGALAIPALISPPVSRLRADEQLRAPDREQDNVWMFDRAV